MNQYKDLLKDHDKLQLAYDNCKKFVDDENGVTDITYEDVRTMVDYVADLEYNIAVMLEEMAGVKKALDSLENEVKHTNDNDTGACPHGYTDWSECNICGH